MDYGIDELVDMIVRGVNNILPDGVLPEPDMLAVYSLLKYRILYLGECIDETVQFFQRQIISWNIEDKGKPIEERKPIKIIIMNHGGAVDYMWSLIGLMDTSKTPIYTICMGTCASAAGVIYMAGHKRFITPHSVVMIHRGQAQISGDAGKVIDATNSYKQELKKMNDYICLRTEIPQSTLARKKNNDWELSVDECLKYKVSHKLIESIEEIID